MGLKGGNSIDEDSGPLGYVLWCCGSRSWEVVFTLFQIGSGHTVGNAGKIVSFLVKNDAVTKNLHPTQIWAPIDI